MRSKKITALLLTVFMAAGTLAACGGGGTQKAGTQEITVFIAEEVETMDPALNSSVDGSVYLENCFAGVYGYKEENGKLVIVPECATAVVTPTEIEGGRYQYVLTLKEGLKWSDGSELLASDFVYAWKRAADPKTASDYRYMFDVIEGYDAASPNLNIVADDAARTITIVLKNNVPYFNQLLAFATFYPVKKSVIDANPTGWFTKPETFITNGAFKMSEWDVSANQFVFVKNDNYWDAVNVILTKITYVFSDDDIAMYANFKNNTIQYSALVPQAELDALKASSLGKEYNIAPRIGTYFIEFNVNVSFKPGTGTATDSAANWADWTPEQNAKVRHALGLIIDRNYIVANVTKANQIPARGFVPVNVDDGTGSEYRSKGKDWWSVASADQQKNVDEAVAILKDLGFAYDETAGKFTNFPVLQFSFNPTSTNMAIVESVQNMWKGLGIETSIDSRAWSVLQKDITAGNFVASRLGWIADFNDPINFLEIYLSNSGNNHPQLGVSGTVGNGAFYGPNADKTWKEYYDALISKVKTTSDPAERAGYIHEAEAAIEAVYPVLPLYYYTNPYLKKEALKDVLVSPLGFVSFKHAYLAE